jgi:hypothetical protein
MAVAFNFKSLPCLDIIHLFAGLFHARRRAGEDIWGFPFNTIPHKYEE